MSTWINDGMTFILSMDSATTHMLMTPKSTLPAPSLLRARSAYPTSCETSVLSWSGGTHINMPQTELISPNNLNLLFLLCSLLLWMTPPPAWLPKPETQESCSVCSSPLSSTFSHSILLILPPLAWSSSCTAHWHQLLHLFIISDYLTYRQSCLPPRCFTVPPGKSFYSTTAIKFNTLQWVLLTIS